VGGLAVLDLGQFPVISHPVAAKIRDVLMRCRLFRQVTAQGLDRIAAIAVTRRYLRGERIFAQGDPAPGLYVVDEGAVRVFKAAPSGKEHVIHLAEPGQTFAEAAVMGGFPCPAHAEATADTSCVLLPCDAFRALLDGNPELPRQLLTGMAVWVHQLVSLLEDVVLRDAAGRLARYLLDQAEDDVVLLPTLKRHLASHLNLTSETFSRTLSRLVDRGLILRESGGRVRLLDAEGLRFVAKGL
jgi:CRP-like cAMP-binding protein